MESTRNLDAAELEAVLRRAHLVKAPTSLRAEGGSRILGDLQLRGLEPGVALHLLGAKRRDLMPPSGTRVTLSILLGEEALSIHSTLLEPLLADEGDTLFPPVLRVAWPSTAVGFHHRDRVRVAAPQQTPLPARVSHRGRWMDATVLNLNETGLGLGFDGGAAFEIGEPLCVETDLPECGRLQIVGEVRHTSHLLGDPLPDRVGLVLGPQGEGVMETLRSFIQGRRTDRSENFRQGGQ
ncbi:MAG: hypothetical protein HY823_05990 [Acidobacteria bacterium]|nr:hypothetical protein [Acidobacteriota bacterium]